MRFPGLLGCSFARPSPGLLAIRGRDALSALVFPAIKERGLPRVLVNVVRRGVMERGTLAV